MGFTFGENTLALEIMGTTYRVDPFSEAVLEHVKKFHDHIAGADMVALPDTQKIQAICAEVGRMLDDMLGDGAYAAIFAGRVTNLLDHYEVAMHVIGLIMTFRQQRIADFTRAGLRHADKTIRGQGETEAPAVQ